MRFEAKSEEKLAQIKDEFMELIENIKKRILAEK